MCIRFYYLLFFLTSSMSFCQSQNIHAIFPYKKIILWGHKLHSHSHSYIHWGFYRAFKSLGYETHWFDNNDDISNYDLSDSLFITEGQVDAKIPLRGDCDYILHNCTDSKYVPIINKSHALILQVYTHDCLSRNVIKLQECVYFDLEQKVLYMPWATDLLPEEIDAVKKKLGKRNHKDGAIYIGFIGGGYFGNSDQVEQFKNACCENGVPFNVKTTVSAEENCNLVARAYMAPAIQGVWQCEKGYIPCRIFKNISYGNWGITNSKAVCDLFEGKIVYNSDPYRLFYDTEKYIESHSLPDLFYLMDNVRDNHTYLNRIETLLSCMRAVKEACL